MPPKSYYAIPLACGPRNLFYNWHCQVTVPFIYAAQKVMHSLKFLFGVALRPNTGLGLLILEVSRSHPTAHQNRWDSSGRVIGTSQRPLPDNREHSQRTITSPAGFEPTTSVGEKPQTYTSDRVATATGNL